MQSLDFPGPGAIRSLAAALNQAHEDLRVHPGQAEYQKLAHLAFNRLYSPNWNAIVTALKNGDARAVTPATDFLEVDPRCFRSGYAKEHLCQYLARMELSEVQRRRLVPVVTAGLAEPHRPQRERKRWEHPAEAVGVAIPAAPD